MTDKEKKVPSENPVMEPLYTWYGFMNRNEIPLPPAPRVFKRTNPIIHDETDIRPRRVKHKQQRKGYTRNWRLKKLEEERRKEREQVEEFKAQARTWTSVGENQQAIDLYTSALLINSKDTESLLRRASCYLSASNYAGAVEDANSVLQIDNTIAKAHFIKAEAAYQQGEFELALVHYYRAHKLRPGVKDHEHGIRKAQRAIENTIGDSAGVKLEKNGDLSYFRQQTEITENERFRTKSDRPLVYLNSQTSSNDATGSDESKRRSQSAKTVKQLLGELYGDWKYLDRLLNEEENLLKELGYGEKKADNWLSTRRQRKQACKDTTKKHNESATSKKNVRKYSKISKDPQTQKKEFAKALRDLALEELKYLHKRTEFWRQNKSPPPEQARPTSSSYGAIESPTQLLELLEEIEQDQNEGHHEESLAKAEEAMRFVKSQKNALDDHHSYEGTVNSLMGNAHYEMGKYDKALACYEKDLNTAEENDLEDAKSRALDNIGRLYVKTGNYREAVKIFEEKLPLATGPLELTWIHHELGRCYLETRRYVKALIHGEKSLENAQIVEDNAWCLNANVLIAQAQVQLEEYEAALEVFERAMSIAERDDDKTAKAAIQNAIQDLHNRFNQDTRTEQKNYTEKEKEEIAKDEEDKESENDRRDSVASHNGEGDVNRKTHDATQDQEVVSATAQDDIDELDNHNGNDVHSDDPDHGSDVIKSRHTSSSSRSSSSSSSESSDNEKKERKRKLKKKSKTTKSKASKNSSNTKGKKKAISKTSTVSETSDKSPTQKGTKSNAPTSSKPTQKEVESTNKASTDSQKEEEKYDGNKEEGNSTENQNVDDQAKEKPNDSLPADEKSASEAKVEQNEQQEKVNETEKDDFYD